jgi:hypothetical protein
MSRPNMSVPNQASAENECKRAAGFNDSGSTVNKIGAAIAMNRTVSKIAPPKIIEGDRIIRRHRRSRRPVRAGSIERVAMASVSALMIVTYRAI